MRRLVLALVACTACVRTSVDTDGSWSGFDKPCVPVGPTAKKLLESNFSVWAQVVGDSLLYSTDRTITQLDIETGRSKVVLRSDGVSEFGVIDDALVYYESNGDPTERRPIDVIIDHGARSTSRYQRISPRHGLYNAGLVTTKNGVYWWTAQDFDQPREDWRWNPSTNAVEPFPMRALSAVRADGESFFYIDMDNRIVVRSQTTNEVTVLAEYDPEVVTPYPIAIDRGEAFYILYRNADLVGDLVAHHVDGNQRSLLVDHQVVNGAIDPTYVYFTEAIDEDRGDILRVPRAGGSIETFFDGEDNTDVFDIVTDGCNVYWQYFAFESGAVYGREITP